MSNITNFKSQLKGGGARPNLFEATLYFPGQVSNGGTASSLSRFMVKAAQLPSSVITPIEVPYRGRKLKIAGDRTFEAWTVTILNDTDFAIRRALEQWMDQINRHGSNTSSFVGQGYMANMEIRQLGRRNANQVLRTYRFIDAWPSNLGAIDVNWETNDTVEEYTVEWSYQYWTTPGAEVTGQ